MVTQYHVRPSLNPPLRSYRVQFTSVRFRKEKISEGERLMSDLFAKIHLGLLNLEGSVSSSREY